MGAYSGRMHDPDLDGPVKLSPKQVPRTRVPRLLGVVASLSVTWAALSMFFFLRAEWPRRQRPSHMSGSQASSNSAAESPVSTSRPFVPRPLFAFVPDSIREKALPGSEISLAADVRAAEERGGAALWESHRFGAPPYYAQVSASDCLSLHVQQGRKVDGWLMQATGQYRIDGGMDPMYIFEQGPPGYHVTLRFPETLAGYHILLSGYNYDSQSKEFVCADRNFEPIKPNDWVRVSGVLRPGSRLKWNPSKGDDFLSLGEMTISDIQRVEVVRK